MKNYSGFGKVTIGGQERPVYFGIMQAKVYCQTHSLEFDEYQERLQTLGAKSDPFLLANLVYSALIAGCKYSKEGIDFTEDDVVFWVQELNTEAWEAFFKIMQDANSPNVEGAKTAPVNA
jgi:hypothetical protein